MNFVHSLSTKPYFIDLYNINAMKRFIGNIAYYALSLAYLKKLGQKVVLHTDSLGAQLLGFLPYDEIYLTLDDIPSTFCPRFWASAKILALEKEPLKSIHIDGDVFLKKEAVLNKIKKSNWDLLVQSEEDTNFHNAYKYEVSHFKKYANLYKQNFNLDLTQNNSYNTGILSFRNEELKDKFITVYKNIVEDYSKKEFNQLLSQTNRTPDLITEQLLIHQLSDGFKTKCLIQPTSENETLRERCNEIGYQHVITMAKFSQIDKCLETLKSVSPIIYEKTYKLCHEILNK